MMIAYLKGTLKQKSPNLVVIDVGGVGYAAAIPLSTFVRMGEMDEPAELFIYTHLTDSSLSLFGFSTDEEREIFLKLIGISGIGPKLGLNILSGIGPRELEEAVRQSDVARLALIPGIGRKTALRIAIELQTKLERKEKILTLKGSRETEDLISALVNMGFKRKEVEPVVNDVIKKHTISAGIEVLLRECLKHLAKF